MIVVILFLKWENILINISFDHELRYFPWYDLVQKITKFPYSQNNGILSLFHYLKCCYDIDYPYTQIGIHLPYQL